MHSLIRLPLLAATTLAFSSALSAQTELGGHHVDIGVALEGGALVLHWHDETADIEYAPGDAYAFIPLTSFITRPIGSAWDFTGAIAGGTIYVAPQDDATPDVIFLGLAAEEIADGNLVGNSVTFSLVGVTGPGHFSLYLTDSFGEPVAGLGSASGPGSLNFITGRHEDYNWGFTAPGVYAVTLTVNGLLNDGFGTAVSDTATFTFAVGTAIPEPSSAAALAGLAILGLALTRRRARA